MIIRLLEPRDAEMYYDLRLEALEDSPHAFVSSYHETKKETPQKYKHYFQSGDSFTFGAFIDHQLIGVVTLIIETREKIKHRATLVAMYVTPEHRGKGIGKALILEAIQKAKEIETIEQINLSVTVTNEAAYRLYSSLGFETFGVEKRALKVDGEYLDGKHMVLFLK